MARRASSLPTAAGPLRAAVVCDDDEVRTWAEGQGAEVIWTPGLGLNGAVAAGVAAAVLVLWKLLRRGR